MSEQAYFILRSGEIVRVEKRHILTVVADPEPYGETKESLQQRFDQHGQGMESNVEGKAREEVLLRVISRNIIRIRKNQHPRNQHWSIQLWKLTKERKEAISKWAVCASRFGGDQFADVIIHQFCDNSKKRTSLDQLAGEHPSGDVEIASQDELMERYECSIA
jgi:hypothetical protein